MIMTGLILAGLAALLHMYIFYMESVAWTSKKVRAVFGTTEAQANATRGMAFNQGFYNLFLAVVTGLGIVLYLSGRTAAGAALVFAGIGSMTAAALVLLLSAPDKKGAALKQGTLPALSVIALVVGFLT